MRDFEKARVVLEAQEEEDKMAEEMRNTKRNQQLKKLQQENFRQLVDKQSISQRHRDLADNIKDGQFLTTVRIQDIADPKDDYEERMKKANITRDLLKEQTAHRKQAKEDGNGKFFGMTDEEILLNKDVFIQMGLI